VTAGAVQERHPAWLTVAVLVLLIGPHWLVMRDQFDGATIAFAAATGLHDGIEAALRDANWPVALAFHKACIALGQAVGVPYLVFVKLTLTLLLAGLYLELRCLAHTVFGLPAAQARQAALLGSASPVLYTLVSSQIVPILLCVWLVFFGHRLYRQASAGMRVLGWAVLAVSFQLNSNLVFALALELVWLVRLGGRFRTRLAASALLLATAAGVYMTMRWLLPPAQIFTEYNQLLKPWRPDDLRRIVKATLMFLTWGVIPLGAVLIAAACVAARGTWPRLDLQRARAALGAHGPMLAGTAFLCAAAAFPYVMVGKGPPLFTLLSIGDGLTEQVLRAAHGGPLAPTWANSSGRHALLYGAAMGLLAWATGRLAWHALGGAPGKPPRGVFALTLAMMLAWVLPAYWNKLQTQYAEQSLVHGLRSLPPAPPGVIELSYRPVTDWLVWTQSAGMILREAWGKAPYWPSFHAVEAYRLDMQWQYHAYLRQTGGLTHPAMQHFLGIDGLVNEDCISRYRALLPPFDATQVLLAGVRPAGVPAATIDALGTDCQPGRVLPNPLPDKKLIP
jgi:uncharacterized membrane protein